ncbi:hypothetical protein JTB14_011864 [Gonioctena quinquepunctata]|nr:hypothetical protein JTB14_011864 [Gonioctena quinquepunctata]
MNVTATSNSFYGNSTFNSILNNENSNVTETLIPYSERPETYIVPVLFFLIFVVGVLGNGTLVVIFLRHKNMRNVPNTYILSLAMGDSLSPPKNVPLLQSSTRWSHGFLGEMISKYQKQRRIHPPLLPKFPPLTAPFWGVFSPYGGPLKNSTPVVVF